MYFEQQFLVFKQYYTYFYTFFTHIFFKNTNNIIVTSLLNKLLLFISVILFLFLFFVFWFFFTNRERNIIL